MAVSESIFVLQGGLLTSSGGSVQCPLGQTAVVVLWCGRFLGRGVVPVWMLMIRIVWYHVWLIWFPGRGVVPGRPLGRCWPLDGMMVCWSVGFVLVRLNDDPVGWYWSSVMVVCWSGGTVLAVLDGGLLA